MYIGIFEGPLQMYFWGKNKTWLFEIRISLFLITFHSERQRWIISPIAPNRQKLACKLLCLKHTRARTKSEFFDK